MTTSLTDAHRSAAADLLPLLRRAADLDPRCLARLVLAGDQASAFVRLPFDALVSRSVVAPTAAGAGAAVLDIDLVAATSELVGWLTGQSEPPAPRPAEWRASAPPRAGWRRLETVPDEVVRRLVRTGALAVKEARAQPRTDATDALLDAVVLTVSAERPPASAQITLRALSALTRMGFLPRGGSAHIDVSGRWIRIVGGYGTVYLERAGAGLTVVGVR